MKKVQAYLIILFFCISPDLYTQVPDWQWAESIHTNGNELARDVAADPVTGNIYIAGVWRNDLSGYFPGNSYPSTDFSSTYGGDDGLVVKYDQNGTILWAFKIGGTGDDEASAITLDSSGNIYITGYIDDGTNYFSGTSSSTPDSTIDNSLELDFFIAKYDPDGALLWVRHSDGSSGDAKGLSIYAENSSVFASGFCTGSTSFGPFSGTFNQGDEDYFVAKYDVNGSEQWLLEGGSDRSDFAFDVLSDGTNVYFVGSYEGNTLSVLDTSGTNVVSMENANDGKTDIFILSFDINSNYNWGQKISSTQDDDGYGITHDTDSLYITGGISNFANFPEYINNPVTVSSGKDIFISSHSKTNANTGWVRVVDCTAGGNEEGLSIVTDSTHSIYVTGYFSKDLNFGDTTITAIGGNPDIFVASFLDNGTFNWAKMAGSSGNNDIGYGISTDNSTNIYIAGHYNQQAFFDTETFPDDGGLNIFLANIELTCIDAEGGTASTTQDHICLSESTTILLTGYYGMIQWQSSQYGLNNWTDISGENAETLIVTPNDTTDYRAFLTSDPCQPDSSNTLTVNVDLQPESDAGTDAEICISDGSYSITGSTSANGTILWTSSGDGSFDAPTTDNPTYTIGTETGSVTLTKTVSSPGSCADAVDFMVLTLTPEPTSDAGANAEICISDGSYSITGSTSANGTILWTSSGDGSFDDAGGENPTYTTGTETSSVTLTKTVSSPGSCADADDFMILTLTPEPTSDAGADDEICISDGSYTIIGSTSSNGTILWTTSGDGSFDAPTTDNPTYTIGSETGSVTLTKTVSSAGSCADADDFMVLTLTPDPTSDAGAGGDECDLDYALQATASVGTGTWTKTSGPGIETFTPDATTPDATVTVDAYGTYEFTWTEVNGTCSDDSTITVNFYEQPVANAGPGGDECDLDYALQATLSAGTGTWTKTLGPGTANFTADAGTPNALVVVDEYGSYEFTWTEVNGICSADSTIIIHFYEPPIADAGQDISLCIGEESQLNASGGVTYSWSPETGLNNSNIADPIVSPTITTLYTLIITDLNGCSDQDTVKVTVNPLPEAEAGEDITIYYGSDTVLNASGGIFYSWNPATGLSDPGISNPIASPVATTTYFVSVTDSKGCQNTDSIKITILPGDFANAGSDDSICPGESINLSASGGISYSWSPTDGLNDPNISNPIASPTITTTYTVAVTDNNGVQDTDDVTITVNPLPDIDVGEDINICDGESVQLQASGEGTFQWDHSNMLSNSNIPNPIASLNITTTFTVTLTDQNGCENFDELTVVVHKQPIANAGPDQELDYVFEITMEAELSSLESGEWSVISGSGEFSDKNSPVCMVTGLSMGDNIFSWEVTNGVCTDFDEMRIIIDDLLIPSVITPNGDMKNDYFVVRGIDISVSVELTIFNRWSAEVYKNNMFQNDWDGRDHNGNELPADTYFYMLKLVDGRVLKGFVVIKR